MYVSREITQLQVCFGLIPFNTLKNVGLRHNTHTHLFKSITHRHTLMQKKQEIIFSLILNIHHTSIYWFCMWVNIVTTTLIITTLPLTQMSANFNPKRFLSFSNLSCLRDFVKTLTTCSSVLHTWSLRKWNFVSMCLLLPWEAEFLNKLIAYLLSTHNCIGLWNFSFNSSRRVSNHKHWHAASAAAIYLTSHEEKATTFCFFKHHEIGAFMYLNR